MQMININLCVGKWWWSVIRYWPTICLVDRRNANNLSVKIYGLRAQIRARGFRIQSSSISRSIGNIFKLLRTI